MRTIEFQLQKACVQWLGYQHPKYSLLCWATNNNARDARSGAVMKAMGVKAGVPDLLFLLNGVLYGFEFKTAKGRISEAQEQFHFEAKKNGMQIYIIRELEEFTKQIEMIIQKH